MLDGLLTVEDARDCYGVALMSAGGEIDVEATAGLRSRAR
jgi:hypothetical protein